jgi:CheY-like chemotaxis protein
MTNVLVVDDSLSNLIVVESLLEQFSDNSKIELSIDTALNGQEAIDKCEIKRYDIIFMDIMMPIMDGIEATKILHSLYPSTMIIAVSAVNDSVHEKEILHVGAEDYIHKPINTELFLARIKNYAAIIKTRLNKSLSALKHTYNCINQNIYTRKMNFHIESDDNLAEFWEYYLVENRGEKELIDLIRTFHEIGSFALLKQQQPEIWVEYTKDFTYFTMCGLSNISGNHLKLLLGKYISTFTYKIISDRFSVVVSNSMCTITPDLKENVQNKKEVPVELVIETVTPLVADVVIKDNSFVSITEHEKHIYNYMSDVDLLDIKEYLSKLHYLLMLVSKGDIEIDEVEEIASYLDRMSRISCMYTESYSIGIALGNFSREIFEHISKFQAKSVELGELCIAFGHDIGEWITLIFEEGASSVNCMDESIIFNSLMLCQMLTDTPDVASAVTVDDIFNF